MRVAVIGAGPTGLVTGMGLARRGHSVTVVDRDPGPSDGDAWNRRGVMQFHHAHAFRPQVAAVLQAEAPAAWAAWLSAGAEPVEMSRPAGATAMLGVRSRRATFERALRRSALAQPGLELRIGHVDAVTSSGGRATGLRVDGSDIDADLVLDASGRSGRVTRPHRTAPALGGECGIAYVDRQYRLRPGVSMPPMTNPIAWQGNYDGYQVLVFPHEHGIFSCLIIRSTADRSLVGLRHNDAFEAAAAAIPGLAAWTAPDVASPVTDVLPGGPLLNVYRGQRGADGRLALPGLVFVGDAVCTTTPSFGRGVTTSLMQATELLRLVDEHGDDVEVVGEELDAWCSQRMRPWVEDHIAMDTAQASRWDGHDIDLSVDRLPSDVIMMASAQDPSIDEDAGPYLAMQALPSALDPADAKARAVYATGWRPAPDQGPTKARLAEIVARTSGSR